MNWFKKAKNDNDFDFSEEKREVWRAMVRKEQDDVGISFDMENDENISSVRRIKLKTKRKSMNDDLAVFAQLWQAGGDWQNPVCYFRCQIKEENYWGPKFIYIPKKNEGNENLTSSKEKGKFTACDSNKDENVDYKERELWEAFEKHVEKRANEFYNKGDDIDKAEEYGMYDNSKSLSLAKSNSMAKEAQYQAPYYDNPGPLHQEGEYIQTYKFVKVNEQYRFLDNSDKHSSVVQEGETAEAAGTIFEYKDRWKLYQSYSSTLQIGCGEEHIKELEPIIGKSFKDEW